MRLFVYIFAVLVASASPALTSPNFMCPTSVQARNVKGLVIAGMNVLDKSGEAFGRICLYFDPSDADPWFSIVNRFWPEAAINPKGSPHTFAGPEDVSKHILMFLESGYFSLGPSEEELLMWLQKTIHSSYRRLAASHDQNWLTHPPISVSTIEKTCPSKLEGVEPEKTGHFFGYVAVPRDSLGAGYVCGLYDRRDGDPFQIDAKALDGGDLGSMTKRDLSADQQMVFLLAILQAGTPGGLSQEMIVKSFAELKLPIEAAHGWAEKVKQKAAHRGVKSFGPEGEPEPGNGAESPEVPEIPELPGGGSGGSCRSIGIYDISCELE